MTAASQLIPPDHFEIREQFKALVLADLLDLAGPPNQEINGEPAPRRPKA